MQAWQTLARNYRKFEPPLTPAQSVVSAFKSLVPSADAKLVVLGSTPSFSDLASEITFIDSAAESLALVDGDQHGRVCKNWVDAAEEFAGADVIIGDGSLNALGTDELVAGLLTLIINSTSQSCVNAQRVFINPEFNHSILRDKILTALSMKRFSEARFLIYSAVTPASGVTRIADTDQFVHELEQRLDVDASIASQLKADYFEWRGLPPEQAMQATTRAFYPTINAFTELLSGIGVGYRTISAGDFPLAEFTPICILSKTGD